MDHLICLTSDLGQKIGADARFIIPATSRITDGALWLAISSGEETATPVYHFAQIYKLVLFAFRVSVTCSSIVFEKGKSSKYFAIFPSERSQNNLEPISMWPKIHKILPKVKLKKYVPCKTNSDALTCTKATEQCHGSLGARDSQGQDHGHMGKLPSLHHMNLLHIGHQEQKPMN